MSDNLAVLQGKGRQGDFVHVSQKMGTEAGFRNVSNIWLQNGTISYQQGFEQLAKHKADSEDILCSVQDMVPTVYEGKFAFVHRPSERFFRPTEFAMSRIGSWADTGSWYVNHLLENPTNQKDEVLYERDWDDADTLCRVVRNGFRRLDQDKKFLWRVNKSSGKLRTMVSDRYACVDNAWFLESLQKILPGGRLSHWDKSDEETIYGNILIPDSLRKESDSDYGGMLSVGNSQIGERSISTLPSVFRAICMNGCIWDQTVGKGFRRKHLGKMNLGDLFLAIKQNLEAQIPLIPIGIDKLLGTRKMAWDGGSVTPLFAAVAGEYKLSKKQATAVLSAWNEEVRVTDRQLQSSLFGVVNAVTRAAQTFEKSADWYKFDSLGGTLTQLDADDWSNLTSYAKKMDTEEVEAAFSLSA